VKFALYFAGGIVGLVLMLGIVELFRLGGLAQHQAFTVRRRFLR